MYRPVRWFSDESFAWTLLPGHPRIEPFELQVPRLFRLVPRCRLAVEPAAARRPRCCTVLSGGVPRGDATAAADVQLAGSWPRAARACLSACSPAPRPQSRRADATAATVRR